MTEFLKYDPHNHSSFSDGHETPEEIAQAAAGRVDFLGLSDHNTVAGIPRFLEAVKRVNDTDIRLQGVPSTEISTSIGHMILAVPDSSVANHFLDWARGMEFMNIDPRNVILPGVRDFNGICIFTHPRVPFTEGASFQNLERLLNTLPADIYPNLAIETNNYSAHILLHYARIQRQTRAWNQQFGLAEIAGTDSHSKHLAGRFFSLVPQGNGDEPVAEAVRSRTLITPDLRVSIGGKMQVLISHGSEHLKYKTGLDVYPLVKGLL